jgi:hypothetical protein
MRFQAASCEPIFDARPIEINGGKPLFGERAAATPDFRGHALPTSIARRGT